MIIVFFTYNICNVYLVYLTQFYLNDLAYENSVDTKSIISKTLTHVILFVYTFIGVISRA